MKTTTPCKTLYGFDVYAPELIEHSDTFVTDAHINIEKFEKRYFWFSERRKLIYFLINKYFPNSYSYCEIGCGGGYLLANIKDVLPNCIYWGTDIYISGLKIAEKRFPEASYFQSDIVNFPYKDEFELIGIYDVIEHIDNDTKAIQSVYDALTAGGGAIITVPQHMWLWSGNDKYACHKRRYSRKELISICKSVGFKVIRTTSFPSLLMPFFIFNSLLNRKKKMNREGIAKQFNIHPLLNFIFKLICKIELLITRFGMNFPCGGSLVCIVRK